MTALVMEPTDRFDGKWIRYGAVALSLLMHGVLFASYGGQVTHTMQQPNQSVTRLSFLAPEPEPVNAPELLPEIKPEKPIVKSKPKPVQKVKKRPALKKVTEPVQEVVAASVSQPEAVAVATPAAVSPAIPQINEGLIKRETERYLTEVMAHIEQHKWYPKAARRRGIEGEVHISFTLFPDGSARQLIVENGPSLLIAAAREAVEKASPMPTPPASLHCPLECQFRMQFNLNAS